MGKSKEDRQFEILDERLIDIQGKLRTLKQQNACDFAELKTLLQKILKAIENIQPLPQPQPKMKGTVMADYSIPDDQPDGRVTFHLSATDAEGQPITDPAVIASLTFEAMSSNEDAFTVTLDADQPDPLNRVGGYHVGAPGQAAVTGNLKDADGNLIGTGTDGFTVTTGKVALGAVSATFDGLTPIR
jgi:hypothetical protein